MTVIINGEERQVAAATIAALVEELALDPSRVAVERNREIVPRSAYADTAVAENDRLEVVHFIGGGAPADSGSPVLDHDDGFEVAGRRFRSRLLVGTGKYRDFTETARAIAESGAEIVTVAVRRVNLTDPSQPMLVDHVDPGAYTFLPNTAGCYTADDAVRTLRLAREAGGWDLVKLEVLGDEKTLYPDMPETLKAAERLVAEDFKVMVYCSDDPLLARRLEEIGCVAVMPLAAPIGSGLGIQNPVNLRLIVENANVPVLVDAGVGTASEAAEAMEMGCDGVLMNTAIAQARDPIAMARAMRLGVEAGRLAHRAGRMPRKSYADPSSPGTGLIS